MKKTEIKNNPLSYPKQRNKIKSNKCNIVQGEMTYLFCLSQAYPKPISLVANNLKH